jgi:hypothetical protein
MSMNVALEGPQCSIWNVLFSVAWLRGAARCPARNAGPSECSLNLIFPAGCFCAGFQSDTRCGLRKKKSVPRGTRAAEPSACPREALAQSLADSDFEKSLFLTSDINGASGHLSIARNVPPETSVTHRWRRFTQRPGLAIGARRYSFHSECLRRPQAALQCRRIATTGRCEDKARN